MRQTHRDVVRAPAAVREIVGAEQLARIDGKRRERLAGLRRHVLGPHAEDPFAPGRDPAAGARRARHGQPRTVGDVERRAVFRQPPMQQVHRRRTDEARDERRRRFLVHVDGRADLFRIAAIHHDHALRERHRLDLVVRHIDARRREPRVQPLDFEAHLHAQLRIEVRQRLVEQEHRRLANDRAPHRDALPLAARQLARAPREQRPELEDLRGRLHARVDQRALDTANLQPVSHVLRNRHVRIQRVVLEHHRDVAILRLERVDDASTDRDLAFRHRLEAGDHPQQRRFPAARRADEHDELAVGDIDVDPVQHVLRAAVTFPDALQAQRGHAWTSSRLRFTFPNRRGRARTSAASRARRRAAAASRRASPPSRDAIRSRRRRSRSSI
ncbi:phenol hydroxylase, putative [Burkholderia pseudomallei 1710b]|uniref:Phenol hydroxylase, putative n=1 Tax=Burkholderia pseudomallei (strain 1710b) TaxID=320372 RepID=Q3JMW6_BURP1|nr:phenol hydroxylase, putative [Burkholderia pseudomallei 1710b]